MFKRSAHYGITALFHNGTPIERASARKRGLPRPDIVDGRLDWALSTGGSATATVKEPFD